MREILPNLNNPLKSLLVGSKAPTPVINTLAIFKYSISFHVSKCKVLIQDKMDNFAISYYVNYVHEPFSATEWIQGSEICFNSFFLQVYVSLKYFCDHLVDIVQVLISQEIVTWWVKHDQGDDYEGSVTNSTVNVKEILVSYNKLLQHLLHLETSSKGQKSGTIHS